MAQDDARRPEPERRPTLEERARQLVERSCASQGLEPDITDGAVLAAIERLLGPRSDPPDRLADA